MNSKTNSNLFIKFPKFYNFVSLAKFYLGYKNQLKKLNEKLVLASHSDAFYQTSCILDLTEKKLIQSNLNQIENEMKKVKNNMGDEAYDVFYSLYLVRDTQECVANRLNISDRQLRNKINVWREQYENI